MADRIYDRLILGALWAYKSTLSPLVGRQCRFLPTCSEYAAKALIDHGPGSRIVARGAPGLPVRAVGRTRIRPGPGQAALRIEAEV